jgi:Flp pilus assembly pilin Flp
MSSAFWNEEQGQDLVEFSLLLAFIMLATATLTNSLGASATGIWGHAGTTLTNASGAAGNP